MLAAPPQPGFSAHAQSSFAKSAAYDQHRPSYSPTAVHFLLDQLRLVGKQGARVVDLGAGTGKLTELLAARDEQFEILAVEPHADMRQVLAAKKLPRVSVVDGTAESMASLPSQSIDAVTVAQAFHWFATMPALREIHRVLQQHGMLGMVWNIEDYNAPRDHAASSAWEAKAHALTWQVSDESADDQPRFRHMEWRNVFDEQVKKTPLALLRADGDQLFSLPIGEHQEPFEAALPPAQVWERYNTLGHISTLQGKARERAHRTLTDALGAPDVERNGKGEVIVHGSTWMFWTSKIPEEGRETLTDVERDQPGA